LDKNSKGFYGIVQVKYNGYEKQHFYIIILFMRLFVYLFVFYYLVLIVGE